MQECDGGRHSGQMADAMVCSKAWSCLRMRTLYVVQSLKGGRCAGEKEEEEVRLEG